MGLQINIKDESGADINYVKLGSLFISYIEEVVVITVAGYVSKEAREQGFKPLYSKQFGIKDYTERQQKVQPMLDGEGNQLMVKNGEDIDGPLVPANELIDDVVEVKVFDDFNEKRKEKGFEVAAYEYLKTLPEFESAIDDK